MAYLCKTIAGVLLAAMTALPAVAASYRYEPDVCPFKEKSWFDAALMDCATLVATEAGATEAYRLPALRLKRGDAASTAAPVVFVNGGPGGRGVTEVGDWLAHPLRQRHDIILYDARGTGQATPRPCPDLSARLFALIGRDLDPAGALAARRALVRECVGSVPPARRGDFSADALADDLASVGRMFGYQRLNLYAVSYGTRIAAAYARRHPRALERTLLDSVVPSAPYYGEIAANFEAALERAFLRCEADAACHARHPGFRSDYHAVAAALAARPLRWPARRDGGAAIHLDAHDFALLVQQLMYGKDFVPVLPLLFAQLRGGDTGALPLLYEIAIGMRTRSLNFGVYYLALLNDEAQPAGAAANAATRGDELLFFRHDMEALAGLGRAVSAPAASPTYAGPVQIVAGGLDPVTAPRYGRQLAQQGGGGRDAPSYREIPGVGHTPTLADACAGPAVAAFFAGGRFAPAPGCLAAATSGYWTGQLYQAAWPRSMIESVFVEQSLAPLAAPAAMIVLHCALIVWGIWLLWRTRKGRASAAPDPDQRRVRLAARIGVGSGVLALLGVCVVVGSTIAGPAPALLLFGFAVGAPVVAGIGGLLPLSAGCLLFGVAAHVRRRRGGERNGDKGVVAVPRDMATNRMGVDR